MSAFCNPDDTAPTGATVMWMVIIYAIVLFCLIGGLIGWTVGRLDNGSTGFRPVTTAAEEESHQPFILMTGEMKP